MMANRLALILIQVAYILAIQASNITENFEYSANIVNLDSDLQKVKIK